MLRGLRKPPLYLQHIQQRVQHRWRENILQPGTCNWLVRNAARVDQNGHNIVLCRLLQSTATFPIAQGIILSL